MDKEWIKEFFCNLYTTSLLIFIIAKTYLFYEIFA